MKYLLATATALASAALVATPASAAVTVTTSMTPFVAGENNGQPIWNAVIGAFLAGDDSAPQTADFTATYTFDTSMIPANDGSASAINVELAPGSNIDFTSIFFNGVAGKISNSGVQSNAFVFSVPITPGPQTLTINGLLNPPSGLGNASFGGTITLAAVPEPATWAMFILGFGLVGAGLRRRTAKVRTAKAQFNFA